MILVVGVNGTGKTTTIGKLAFRLERARQDAAHGGRRHVPRGRRRAARRVGLAGRLRDRAPGRRQRSGGRRLRRHRRRPVARRRRRDRRHRRPPAHPGEPHERARQGAPRDREADPRRAARDPARDRRDDRAERPAPGAGVRRGGRRDRRRAHQARRQRQGRHRDRHPRGARHPHQADRRGGEARGPAPVRSRRVRSRAVPRRQRRPPREPADSRRHASSCATTRRPISTTWPRSSPTPRCSGGSRSPSPAKRARLWLDEEMGYVARDGTGRRAVVLRTTGKVIGGAGLVWRDLESGREIELGYHLHHALLGPGLRDRGRRGLSGVRAQLGLRRVDQPHLRRQPALRGGRPAARHEP